mmetsp:Transcript_14533/g.52275  ORF Transcript_14533/g.52275 Transcript_14533/m.52275 type:complete len:341 (-) Transcript_14533:686-1708(-)
MFAYSCSTDPLAHAARVGDSPMPSHAVSNHVASSTSWFGSGAGDFPFVRFHSASARAMSSCSALDLARQTAMSDATSFTSIFSIAAAAAIAAARSPSRSPPVFLFFGSFFAVSRADAAAFAAAFVARFALTSPMASIPHRAHAHSNPHRFATAFRSDFGAVTSKYFTHTSSPATRSRAARVNIVCPIRSLHAFGAHEWFAKDISGYTPTDFSFRIADVVTTFFECVAKSSWLGTSEFASTSSPRRRCLRNRDMSGTGAVAGSSFALAGSARMRRRSSGFRDAAPTRPRMSPISAPPPVANGATASGEETHRSSPATTSRVVTSPRPCATAPPRAILIGPT